MKIDRIIFSSDDNPNYIQFWKPIARHYYHKFGWKSTLAYVGDKANAPEAEYFSDVIVCSPIDSGHGIAWQTTWAYFYATQFYPDETCMIMGIDQIMASDTICHCLADFPDDDYVMLISDGYGTNKLEWTKDTCEYVPTAYHVARGDVFTKVHNLDSDFTQEITKLYDTGFARKIVSPEPLWGIDERYATKNVRDYFNSGRGDVKSPGLFHDIIASKNRIARGGVHGYNSFNVISGETSEIHCPRPYADHEDAIQQLLNEIPVCRSDIFVHATASIDYNAAIGKGTKIWANTHIRENTNIGLNCTVGECVYIDEYVSIGNRCKIQNGCQIYRGVTIEDGVFVGPGVITTNDKYPKADTPSPHTKTLIKSGASIGANVTILAGIIIGENAQIGCGAVLVKDVPANTTVSGK